MKIIFKNGQIVENDCTIKFTNNIQCGKDPKPYGKDNVLVTKVIVGIDFLEIICYNITVFERTVLMLIKTTEDIESESRTKHMRAKDRFVSRFPTGEGCGNGNAGTNS